ncbi:MAG: AbrB/MazE/SpoVT family DNA-binding domain-containing protein [Xanthobacteraceae bacterium]
MTAAKSKSQRMRELAAAGMSRADIARKLGVRYQFVRNVLEKDRARKEKASAAGGFSDRPQAELGDLSAKLKLGPDGRIVIPAAFREALGLGERDTLFARIENGEIHLLTAKAVMRRANSIVRQFVPEGVSLVDELLEDRRREVEREKENG